VRSDETRDPEDVGEPLLSPTELITPGADGVGDDERELRRVLVRLHPGLDIALPRTVGKRRRPAAPAPAPDPTDHVDDPDPSLPVLRLERDEGREELVERLAGASVPAVAHFVLFGRRDARRNDSTRPVTRLLTTTK
jgi:hypothetical protein